MENTKHPFNFMGFVFHQNSTEYLFYFLNFLCYKKLKQKILILNIVNKPTNMNQKQAFIILLFALLLAPCALGATNNDRVELKNVKALTLKKNAMTTGRRGAPVPQLQCSGHLCNYAPDTIQCVNVGSDGIDAQWECKANLPKTIELAVNSVSCEGYEHPNDPYILKGSCGLIYTLKGSAPRKEYGGDGEYANDGSSIGFVAGAFILLLILCSCNNGRGYSGGTPYATPVPPAAGYAGGYGPGYHGGYGGYRSPGYFGTRSSGPGFFTGLGVGALAGNAYGNRGGRRRSSGGSFWGSSSRPAGRHTSTSFGGSTRR